MIFLNRSILYPSRYWVNSTLRKFNCLHRCKTHYLIARWRSCSITDMIPPANIHEATRTSTKTISDIKLEPLVLDLARIVRIITLNSHCKAAGKATIAAKHGMPRKNPKFMCIQQRFMCIYSHSGLSAMRWQLVDGSL